MSEDSHFIHDGIKKLQLFFIIGRSRSGTTLLRSMLDSHSEISVPKECTFILQLAKKYNKINFWDIKIVNSFLNDLKLCWQYTGLGIDETKLRSDIVTYAPEIDYITICKIVLFNSKQSKSNINFLGDKNPSYSIYFDELYQLFKNECKYIYIQRDYRDQFFSQKNAGIEIPNVVVSAKRWVRAYKNYLKVSKNNPSNCHFLSYENLVTNTETELKKICKFLLIGFETNMLNFNSSGSLSVFTEIEMHGIHKSLNQPVSSDKISSWRGKLKESEVAVIEKITEKYAIESGYFKTSKISVLNYLWVLIPGLFIYYSVLLSSWLIKFLPTKLYLKFSAGAFLGKIWNHTFRY